MLDLYLSNNDYIFCVCADYFRQALLSYEQMYISIAHKFLACGFI